MNVSVHVLEFSHLSIRISISQGTRFPLLVHLTALHVKFNTLSTCYSGTSMPVSAPFKCVYNENFTEPSPNGRHQTWRVSGGRFVDMTLNGGQSGGQI
jgi:hypothetical protein